MNFHIVAREKRHLATLIYVKSSTDRQQENVWWHDFTFFDNRFLRVMYGSVRKICSKKSKIVPKVFWYIIEWKILRKKILFLFEVIWYLNERRFLHKKVLFGPDVIWYWFALEFLRKKYFFAVQAYVRTYRPNFVQIDKIQEFSVPYDTERYGMLPGCNLDLSMYKFFNAE